LKRKIIRNIVNLQVIFKHLNQSFIRGLSIYYYYKSVLEQTQNLKFQTFQNNFVLANTLFSIGNIFSKNTGEFLFLTT